MGKTMLMHIVAKHCGYEIMEINARYTKEINKNNILVMKEHLKILNHYLKRLKI